LSDRLTAVCSKKQAETLLPGVKELFAQQKKRLKTGQSSDSSHANGSAPAAAAGASTDSKAEAKPDPLMTKVDAVSAIANKPLHT
jgi:hypothetical protein